MATRRKQCFPQYASKFQGTKNQQRFYFGVINKVGRKSIKSLYTSYIQEKGYVYNRNKTYFNIFGLTNNKYLISSIKIW